MAGTPVASKGWGVSTPQRQAAQTVLYSSKRKTHKEKREKRKQGARLVETLKSHITQIQNFISRKLQSPQRIIKSFFTFKKNYNQQICSSHRPTPSQGKNHKKEKEKEKEKENKEKRKEKDEEKRGDGEKRGERGIMEKEGLKSFPSKAYRSLRIRSPVKFHKWEGLGNNTTPTGGKLGKNTTPTNSRAEKPSASSWPPNRRRVVMIKS